MSLAEIRKLDYDVASTSLDVWFLTGHHYRFHEVPPDLARRFRCTAAKRWFYNTHIRGRFQFEELDGDEELGCPVHH